MSAPLFVLAVFTALFAFVSPSLASIWLKIGKETTRPYGHVEYCSRNASDCRSRSASSKLPSSQLALLRKVNVSVNRAIEAVDDKVAFGRTEYWTAKTSKGDCEDFALAKRAKLMGKGFKPSQLLLTMGYAKGIAHTVLVVRTRDGDFVLDNLYNDVKPVRSAPMSFLKIQAPEDGGRWLRVTGKTDKTP